MTRSVGWTSRSCTAQRLRATFDERRPMIQPTTCPPPRSAPASAPLLVAVDDTLFRCTSRHVHGAHWAYDGARKATAGQARLSCGTTFVIAALVVDLPVLERLIALPVLFRLWQPGGPTKPPGQGVDHS
jgi:hypothetical protein